MKHAGVVLALGLVATPALAADPSNLVATARSDSKLYLQWHANGNEAFSVDYLGPEYFGGAQPTCNDFPPHSNIFETTSDVVVVENLEPDTWYFVHVHAIDPVTHQVLGGTSNVIIVKTAPAGAGLEPLGPDSPDYIDCSAGGGDGGGDDDACAQVTFVLLPGSVVFPEVQVTVVDPPSGAELGTVTLPIATPLSISEGSFHLRFGAPSGYEATPAQRGLNMACGDDTVVRLRFRASPPGRR